ncbi:MAG TPA: peptidoglycan DD-metalloendopeptidase family protein [Candidatus Sulfomarinibacteraceae bacterium]|nr:peptidoglycan DD-metalloendopeptidase family protein [Candidatus Sulfomarinibacteraceae bacterium]
MAATGVAEARSANGARAVESAVIEGKGYFVWRADRVLTRPGIQTAQEAARKAKEAGIEHVIVKICDGEKSYPLPETDDDGRKEQATADLIQAMRDEAITIWGWAFVYGQKADPEKQAKMLAQRARQFNIRGLVVNAEDIGDRRWSTEGGAGRARAYMSHLRQELADVQGVVYGFSSYRFMRYQPSFPFAAFMEDCDIAMPQIYWVARGEGDAISNLRRSYEEYKEQFPNKLFIPVGAAYGEMYGSSDDRYFWSASPVQIHRFMDQARAMGLPAVTFWSWEHAYYDLSNQHYNGRELWDAIATHPFDDASPEEGEPGEDAVEIQIRVGHERYRDGLYPQFPYAAFVPMQSNGQPLKYARTVGSTPSSVWAMWRPDILESGYYDISVWVPGQHATTRKAQYHVHGVVGAKEPIVIAVNQMRFSDSWVSLGTFELDADNPMSGQVNLTNHTDEDGRRIAFAAIRWRKVSKPVRDEIRLADGFDAPVGTPDERRAVELWPGHWTDANPFGNYYRLRDSFNYHTGADLNLNKPTWDSDRGQSVYAPASGTVTFAGRVRHWGNIVIIRHDPLESNGPSVYSRLAHLGQMNVQRGQRVQRGQPVGTVGRDEYNGPYHLHFDISPTEVLFNNPGDWPGLDRRRVYRDYIDPKEFISKHRPPEVA